MSFNPLFVTLLVAGLIVVLVVIAYNAAQVRKMRRRIDDMRREPAPPPADLSRERVEPTLPGANAPPAPTRRGYSPPPSAAVDHAESVPPLQSGRAVPPPAEAASSVLPSRLRTRGSKGGGGPDVDIECVMTLQAPAPASAAPIGAALATKLAKPVRWFGRAEAASPWQPISGTSGEWGGFAACFLLANRAGAATVRDIEAFAQLVSTIAPQLPAAFKLPDASAEAARAEALDRLCANLDVQVGLTLLKDEHGQIAGTRLRGVAEASGFRLNGAGCFDYVQDDTGETLFSLQNYKNEPFTAEAMRVASTPGVVLLLDVPRVHDPVRVFDQMRLTARRMSQTLETMIVDDNRRVLDDAAFSEIRSQVDVTAQALRECHIEPGSLRAQQLFG